MMERTEGVKHRFYLTLSRLGLMAGKPIFFWDPTLKNGWGDNIVFFLTEDEE